MNLVRGFENQLPSDESSQDFTNSSDDRVHFQVVAAHSTHMQQKTEVQH